MDDKLDQVLSCLETIDGKLGSIETRLDKVEDGQSKNLSLITGALERLSGDIRSVDTRVADVGGQISHAREEIAQLRAEHGGYLRAIHDDIKPLDRRVSMLEAAD
ncbi:MAG: hypothetical protein ACR2Q4_02450 [Geminicoccaceae bacterium]